MADVSDVQITASLIDDYLQIEAAPVASALAGRFVGMPDTTGQPTLLTVDPSGNLLQFWADSSSHSGWSTTSVTLTPPTGAGTTIGKLVGFSQDGTLNALAYYPLAAGSGSAAVWMQSQQPGTWTQAALTHDAANALGYTMQTDCYVDADGNQFLYGVSGNISPPAFFLVGLATGQTSWDIIYEQFLESFSPGLTTGAAFRMLPGSAAGQFTIAWLDNGILYYQAASISSSGDFAWSSGTPGSFDPKLGALTVSDIVPLPGSAAQNALLVVDSTQTLYLFQGYDGASPSAVTLTGGAGQPAAAATVSAGVDGSGMLFVFVVEQGTTSLWIARQSSAAGASPVVFAPWVALGDALDAIACPATTAGGPELFMVSLSQTVFHMAQTATDQVWATSQLAAPSLATGAPQNVATTTMELVPVDANQTPVPGAIVFVSSDQSATIIVADVATPLAPGVPVPLQADPTGRLTVAMQTTGLAAPLLTFSCTNTDGTTAGRWCQGDVVQVLPTDPTIPPCPQSVAERLANQDPTTPVTAAALQQANIMSPDYADPTGAVNSIIASGGWMQQNGQGGGNTIDAANLKTPHWRIDFTAAAGAQFQLLSETEAHRLLAESRARRAEDALGSVDSIFGDVVHAFEHLWQEVESVAATVENDVLTLVINGVDYAVQTVRQAASALEMIFNRIMQGLTDAYDAVLEVIDFLKQLFEWDDILQTHLVIKWSVNQLVSQMTGATVDAKSWVDAQFSNLKTTVNNGFGSLETVFQGQSFNGFVNATNGGGSTDGLAGTATTTGYAQNGPRCSYVHSKAKTCFSSSTPPTLPTSTGPDPSQGIQTQVQQTWSGSFSSQTSSFSSYVSSNLDSPSALFDLAIVDFLKACNDVIDFILTGLQDIADAVLDAVAAALGSLASGWNASIDIPVISWLYSNVITGTTEKPGPALTILDVFCLLLAVPATILYKVLNNGRAPFTASEVSSITAGPLPWPAFPSTTATVRAAPLQAIPASFIEVMGVIAAIAGFFGIFLDTGNDALAFAEEAPLPGLQSFLSTASVIQGIASQAGGAPWDLFSEGSSNWQSGDGWTVGLWIAQCVPIAYDSVFTYATGGLARYTDELGPVLDSGAGFALLAVGLAALFEQNAQGSPYTGWDYAGDVVSQIQLLFKFLLLSKGEETEAVAMPLLLAVDAIVDIGAMVVQIGDVMEG